MINNVQKEELVLAQHIQPDNIKNCKFIAFTRFTEVIRCAENKPLRNNIYMDSLYYL